MALAGKGSSFRAKEERVPLPRVALNLSNFLRTVPASYMNAPFRRTLPRLPHADGQRGNKFPFKGDYALH
jgi:hypothetical protein